MLLGQRLAAAAPTVLLVALTTGLAVGLALLVRRLPVGRRLGAALAGFSAAVVIAMYAKSVVHLEQPHLWGHCGRFFFVPLVSALWIAVAGLKETGVYRKAAVAFLLLALGLSTTAVAFRWVRRDHVAWEHQWEHVAARIEAGERVHVPIPPPWDFYVQRGRDPKAPANLSPGEGAPSVR